MASNIFQLIEAEFDTLSRVERTIAISILDAPKGYIENTMAEISKGINVSEGSLNNFARKFTGGGFTELKLRIATDLSEYKTKPYTNINAAESVKAAMQNTIDRAMATYNNTFDRNTEEALISAAQHIINSRKIQLLGVYYSGVVAEDFNYSLIKLGLNSSYMADTYASKTACSSLCGDDTVIAITSSGNTKEILEAVEVAKSNGAHIITITSFPHSPITKLADDVLRSISSKLTTGGRPTDRRRSQLLVVDTLRAYIESIKIARNDNNS